MRWMEEVASNVCPGAASEGTEPPAEEVGRRAVTSPALPAARRREHPPRIRREQVQCRLALGPGSYCSPSHRMQVKLPQGSKFHNALADVLVARNICQALPDSDASTPRTQRPAAAAAPRPRGLHGSTFQLTLSALYELGGARRDCVARA